MTATNSCGVPPNTILPLLIVVIIFSFDAFIRVTEGNKEYCALVCSRTSEPVLCIRALGNNVHTFTTIHQIQASALNYGKTQADTFAGQIRTVLRMTEEFAPDPQRQQALQKCNDSYESSVNAYDIAISAHRTKNWIRRKCETVRLNVSIAKHNALACYGWLKKLTLVPNDVIEPLPGESKQNGKIVDLILELLVMP